MRRAAILLAAAILGGGVAGCGSNRARGPEVVVLTIHHSRFVPALVEAGRGRRIRFVVRNTDPIDHELIVGDQGVQDRHERGTEANHPPRDGEVSVAAGTEAATFFDVPTGTVPILFACHLPGHYKYGMRGRLTLRD